MIHPVVCNPVYGPRVSPKYPTRGGAGRASGFPRSSKTSGNVLSTLLSPSSLAVSRVSGSPSNVGSPVAGTNGGLFTIASNGAWTFDPNGDFAALTGEQTATTSVTYHVSDGVAEDEGTLTVTVSAASAVLLPSYVAVCAGQRHTVALLNDGTVAAVGDNASGQCNVSGWADIVAIAAGESHTLGLRSDGTVVSTGSNDYGQCNVSGWAGILNISAKYSNSLGCTLDSLAVGAGRYVSGYSSWADIIQTDCGEKHIVAVTSGKTVVAAGGNTYDQLNVSTWTDIEEIAAGANITVGRKSDGTVIGTGRNLYSVLSLSAFVDIIKISANYYNVLGLKADGTVVSSGNNDFGQRNVSGWADITNVSCGSYHAVGVRADGTLVATGRNDSGQCDVQILNALLL